MAKIQAPTTAPETAQKTGAAASLQRSWTKFKEFATRNQRRGNHAANFVSVAALAAAAYFAPTMRTQAVIAGIEQRAAAKQTYNGPAVPALTDSEKLKAGKGGKILLPGATQAELEAQKAQKPAAPKKPQAKGQQAHTAVILTNG